MKGDQEDFRQRLRLTLPTHWFSDTAPILDAVLSGFGAAWAKLWDLLRLVQLQTRIATATDSFLDLAATDMFARRLKRRTLEPDDLFRARLTRAMRRTRATRASLAEAAKNTGYSIQVFEPAQPADTGAYNVPTSLAWGVVGGWGSIDMPLECLIVATPGNSVFVNELWPEVAQAMPAGGAAWLRIAP